MRNRLFSTTLTAMTLIAGGAAAEPAGHGHGATFGVGVGLGHLSCEDADGNDCGDDSLSAVGLDARAGVMVSPGASIAVEAWGMRHSRDGAELSQLLIAGQVRGWVAPRLWLQGGVGLARTTATYDLPGGSQLIEQTDLVPAVVGGIGVEVARERGYALDLQLKLGSGLYADDLRVYNASVGVGLSFY